VPAAFPPDPAHPLVVGTDAGLLDDLLRLLAAAGTTGELTTGGGALRRAHRHAPLVLVGAEVLATAAVRALPRRPGLLVVVNGEPHADVWPAAVELGAERVVVLPREEAWLVERVAAAVRAPVAPGWLAVVGAACGGGGASTLATALALATRGSAGEGVLLVDGDGWSGGLDLLLGAEGSPGLRWPELAGVSGRVGGPALLAALPEACGVPVLSASREQPAEVPVEALLAVVSGARDSGCRVVVDVPARGVGTDAVLGEADLAVLVVPARLRAAAAARTLLAGAWASALLVSRPVPGGLTRHQVADVAGRPVVAELAADRSAVARSERGEPPSIAARSPFGLVSRQLLAQLAGRAA
jgi:secretion/DNA translocation related CpaE-like protein